MAIFSKYETIPGLRANTTGLATSQFLFGKLASTAGQVVLAGALNSTTVAVPCVMGVIMNKPGPGEEVEFAYRGIVKAMVSTSTLIIGDPVGVNSTSKGTEVAETDNLAFIGKALEASSAANDIISVLLEGPRRF
jgi:uncharacterized protein DUF2190